MLLRPTAWWDCDVRGWHSDDSDPPCWLGSALLGVGRLARWNATVARTLGQTGQTPLPHTGLGKPNEEPIILGLKKPRFFTGAKAKQAGRWRERPPCSSNNLVESMCNAGCAGQADNSPLLLTPPTHASISQVRVQHYRHVSWWHDGGGPH